MLGGAAASARSRPSSDQSGLARFPLYSLFPQGGNRSTIHKVTESLFSTSLSTFGVPTPPPNSPYSPLHLELFNTCSQRVTLEHTDKSDFSKMDDGGKLGMQCVQEAACCPTEVQRQMLENVTSAMQPLAVKTEQRRACCITGSPKKIIHGSDGGCSRTNPVAWVGVAGQNVHVQVKREPQHMHMSELVAVKLEQASPGNKHENHPPTIPASLNNGSIPVGIAVARQRVGDAGLLAALSQKDNQQRMHDIDAAQAAMTVGVANVLCEERPGPLAWPAPPAPGPPAPLWQYPTAQMSMESMMVGGVGVPGVGAGMSSVGGYQLVREPTTGALLLLPAPPDLPHTVVWGTPYSSAPLLLPPPPHPSHHLQLLPGDILASTATLQHTHTHSTRLVTLAPAPQPQPHQHAHPSHSDKRKPIMQPLIAPHALIKIEAEHQEKQPSFTTEPVQQPLLTTHMTYYPPDFQEQACRSQATSPAAPPTPPPEAHESPAHKDASNQTDHIDDDDDESPNHADDHEREVACIGVAHFPEEQSPTALHSGSIDTEDSSSEGMATSAVVGAVEKAINAIERDEALTDNNSSSGGSHDLVIDTGRNTPVSQPQSSRSHVDLSGLELLSNSIEQFERTTPASCMPSLESVTQPLTIDTRTTSKILIKTSPKSPLATATETQRRFEFPPTETNTENTSKSSLNGLGLLCALAEQRFMEEVEDGPSSKVPRTSRPFIKSEPLLSPTDRQRPVDRLESKKDHRHREDSSSSERRRKKSIDKEEKLKYKLEKIRRHNRERKERADGGELEASLRRVTACLCGSDTCSHTTAVPSAQAIVKAMEKDMRERLQELQRQCDEKRAQLNALTPPLPPLSTPSDPSTPAPSPDSDRGSSQKRKVGRPRKVSSPDSSTETIVAKKPKSKSSLVGFLLAKSKLKGGIVCSRTDPPREEINRTSKVRPKLKAEPILKSKYSEEDESEAGLNRSASSSMESLNEVRQKNREKVDRLVRKHSRDDLPELEFAIRRASASSDSDKERRRAKKRRKSVKSKDGVSEDKKDKLESLPQQISKCTLTEQLLDTSPRVLTAMGGLFYAGKLSAVQAPDVYAITLDGERGNKPHILSREETLRDAILEVNPSAASEMPPGTRVCAYWSQQYRCLYPGTVAEPTPPDRHDEKFVAVEFDDGDSGRIAIEDIRLLEPNYPVVEYENPLFTLSKRRRNTSVNSTEEKKSTADVKPGTSSETPQKTDEDRHRDKKKLKKHRKDKIKRRHSSEDDPNTADYIKKKKKKHKCCEDHCKHRKHHKKHHKKHRKKHSGCKDHSSSSGDDNQKKSSSDYVDSTKEDSGDSNDRLSTLIAVEKSPDEKMKTVIKKAVLSKTLVKTAVLDFSNLGQSLKKDKEKRDNLKDSGIGLEAETSPNEALKKKTKRRTVSSTSSDGGNAAGVSKMAAFLPGGALWRWCGPAYRRTAKPRLKKLFYKAIQRGEETLNVGDAAVFLSTGRPDRPYIGRIVALWEARGAMAVRVKWFYHPEETIGLNEQLHYPGGLFESPHTDENDVQTISHKCEVVPLAQYKERMGDDPVKYSTVYDNNDTYYLAGHYDPTQQILKLEQDIPFAGKSNP